jgi:putative ABC transport system permease protein
MKLQQVDAGFHPENVLTMRLGLNFTKYNSDDTQRAFFETLLDKISAQPGVNSAAASMTVPLGDAMRMTGDFQIEGETPAPGQSLPVGHFRIVSPSYFDVLRIPLLAGRVFTKADRPNVPVVSVISATAARRFWPGKDPIGKRFSPDGGNTWAQIVGVVGDVHEYGLNTAPVEALYIPMAQNPLNDGSLIIKTAGEPMGIARRVIELIYEIDPNQPAARIRSLEQVRADSVAAPRLTANLLGLFALLALAIAAAGIGGVMALVVNQRKQEIGVRMALGARPGAILRMVLGQGLALALLGIGIGLVGALGLTRVLGDLLFEVQPTDPVTFAGVAGVLAFSALAACYIPARRAARVDPMVALRSE